MSRRAVTLVEILTASVVLAVALLTLLMVNSSSNRMTMDSYFEFLALQIVQEPIEVFRAVGYPACMNLSQYPIDTPGPVLNDRGLYPVEATMFDRTISLDTGKLPLCLVTVTVSPRSNSQAKMWTSNKRRQGSVTIKAIIPYVR